MNEYIQQKCEVTQAGQKLTCDVLIVGRFGSKAPKSYYIIYQGKKISPYEQKIRGWGLTLNTLFKLVYGRSVANLIPETPSILKLIRKKEELDGMPYVRPRVIKSPHLK